jgi:predicted acetyltransferase
VPIGEAMADIEVMPARPGDRAIVWRLLQLYLHDFSEIDGRPVNERGEFEYRWFDHYWKDPKRIPLLIRVDGEWAGFALVRRGAPNEMAEFFVMRNHRRSGVGRAAAAECFGRFPGRWLVHEIPRNEAATAFWRAVIPVSYEETSDSEGITQLFEITPDGAKGSPPKGASRARSAAGRARTRAAR